MEENNKLALIIAYYLSKYDKEGIVRLGYKPYKQAFESIGNKLNVKATTIKNMRDEFDTLHPNKRVGWYQRELRPSRLNVVEKFGDLSEESLTSIVRDIINNYDPSSTTEEDIVKYLSVLEEPEDTTKSRAYTTRGVTGIRAEEIFKEYFESGLINGFKRGNLLDMRYDGCGYDYETAESPKQFFEVKGLMKDSGGISFTDKEWAIAKVKGQNYHLILISNIENEPIIKIFSDPISKFEPTKRITKTISVSWSVESKALFNKNSD